MDVSKIYVCSTKGFKRYFTYCKDKENSFKITLFANNLNDRLNIKLIFIY